MRMLERLKWRLDNILDYVFVRIVICVLIAIPIALACILVETIRNYANGGACGSGTSLGGSIFSSGFLIVAIIAVPRAVRYLWHNFVVLDMTMTALVRKYHPSLGARWGRHGPVYFYLPIIEKERKRRDPMLKRGVKFRRGRIIRPAWPRNRKGKKK